MPAIDQQSAPMSFHAALDVIDRCLAVAASTAKPDGRRDRLWNDHTDWLDVISLANQHLVAPALWTTFDRLALCPQLPDDVRGYLSLLHARNADRNRRIRQQCQEIGTILQAAGIQAVLLKGAAWLFDGSAAPASDRMMRDIDLLVAAEKFDLAVSALLASGYKEACESLVEGGHFHHAPLLPREGEASVEIHRDLTHRPNLLPASEVVESATEVATGLLLPVGYHRIVHNVIHAQIENGDFVGGVVNLRDTLDLARLMFRYDRQVDWIDKVAEVRARGFFVHLSGAVQVSHRVLNTPLPPSLSNLRSRLHAFRCVHQRRWPSIGDRAEKLGVLSRALAWERDAYALNLKPGSLRSHLLVNKRRAKRALDAFKRMRGG
jgi:Uncharacterised nucleotidyltransferase